MKYQVLLEAGIEAPDLPGLLIEIRRRLGDDALMQAAWEPDGVAVKPMAPERAEADRRAHALGMGRRCRRAACEHELTYRGRPVCSMGSRELRAMLRSILRGRKR